MNGGTRIRTTCYGRGAELLDLQAQHAIDIQTLRRLRIAKAIEAAKRKSQRTGRRTGPASQGDADGAATNHGGCS